MKNQLKDWFIPKNPTNSRIFLLIIGVFISMDKKIENIFKLYENILSNDLLNEVVDSYDNVNFKDYAVGSSKPSSDNINTTLLNDINLAAKNAGVVVDITTAVSGHKSTTKSGNTSRHPSGNAVDISIINGKSVRTLDKQIIDKFVGELVKMGYVRGVESGNPKAVLDYTFKGGGHENHIHVSNVGKNSPNISSGDDILNGTSSISTDSYDTVLYNIGKNIGKVLYPSSMTESVSFGNNTKNSYGDIIIPKNSNTKIKSPISGVIDNSRYVPSCQNQIIIKTEDNEPKYLQFCGISNPIVSDGDDISKGQTLGQTSSDVTVTLLNHNFKKIPLNKKQDFDTSSKSDYDNKPKKDMSVKRYEDPVLAALAQLPFKPFQNQYDETGKMKEKRIGYSTDKKSVDPWILNMIKKPFQKKVNENVERIKKLL
jgi:hypothetical protein